MEKSKLITISSILIIVFSLFIYGQSPNCNKINESFLKSNEYKEDILNRSPQMLKLEKLLKIERNS